MNSALSIIIFVTCSYIFWLAFLCKTESVHIGTTDFHNGHNNNTTITRIVRFPTRINALNKYYLKQVSDQFQASLKTLQSPRNCSTPHVKCGFDEVNGLGCQIHHRVVCLIISYNLNMPLIHDEEEGWPHRKGWSEVFQPLGSRCTEEEATEIISVYWQNFGGPILEKRAKHRNLTQKERFIEYPMKDGLRIPKQLNEIAKRSFPNSTFKYWIGQFLKYTLRLTRNSQRAVDLAKQRFGFHSNSRTVGLHIRRTDKIREKLLGMPSFRSTLDYFKVAAEFFSRTNITSYKRVLVATEDHRVFQKAKSRFTSPTWKIIGQSLNTTKTNQFERGDNLDDSIVDLMLLSECEVVACVQTSNWCWLIEEMMYNNREDPEGRTVSLGGYYMYILKGHTVPETVIEID